MKRSPRLFALLILAAAGCTSKDSGECNYRQFTKTPIQAPGVFRMVTMKDGALYFTVMSGSLLTAPSEIYRISPRGEVMCLTCSIPGSQRFADPSPDQKWLVFQSGSVDVKSSGVLGEVDLTQLYALNLETGRIDQLTFDGMSRIPWWSPDGKFVYWTRIDPDLTFHMVEGEFAIRDGLPTLTQTREMIPVFPGVETEAQVLGKRFAWYEVKVVTSTSLIFAATLGESGNGEIWEMDRSTRVVTNLTKHPEYDELVQRAPNGRQLVFATSRDQFQMRKFIPFSPGPPLIDAAMTIPLILYVIKLQAIPLYFQAFLMNADGSDPVRLFSEEEEKGWFYGWGSWSPDSTQLLLTQNVFGNRLETLLAPLKTRTTLVQFDCPRSSSDWSALKYLPEFDPSIAPAFPVTLGNIIGTSLRPTEISEQVKGNVSGTSKFNGRFDLANASYRALATYDAFSDSPDASPVTGSMSVDVASGEELDDYSITLEVALRRANGDRYETSIRAKGLQVNGSMDWLVGGNAGREEVVFPP